MQIIRDDIKCTIIMIPLFHRYEITRCNIKGCKENPTTVCVHEQATFGMCEKHFLQGKEAETMNLELEF